ncbi:hypothetical protein HK097_005430, partial [Rhizophlyctis rosea]
DSAWNDGHAGRTTPPNFGTIAAKTNRPPRNPPPLPDGHRNSENEKGQKRGGETVGGGGGRVGGFWEEGSFGACWEYFGQCGEGGG